MDKVAGPIYVIGIFQATVVDARICQTSREIGTCQGLMGHFWYGHLVAELAHVLAEEVSIAHIERGQCGIEGGHRDGGNLGMYCKRASQILVHWTEHLI